MVFRGFWLVSIVFQVGFHDFSWFLVGLHGFQRSFMFFSWFLVGIHGFSRWFHVFFMVFGWFPWFFKEFSNLGLAGRRPALA